MPDFNVVNDFLPANLLTFRDHVVILEALNFLSFGLQHSRSDEPIVAVFRNN